MFREMRRKNQVLSSEECIQVLNRATSGVLAVSGDDDYPYAVPLSYIYHNNKIYFHGAKTGHKLDGIMRNEKVSFCVIDQDEIVQEGTLYPILHTLEQQGAVTSYQQKADNGRLRKYYAITTHGQKLLDEKLKEWEVYQTAINQVIGGVLFE